MTLAHTPEAEDRSARQSSGAGRRHLSFLAPVIVFAILVLAFTPDTLEKTILPLIGKLRQ
jgi:hypothetical protein